MGAGVAYPYDYFMLFDDEEDNWDSIKDWLRGSYPGDVVDWRTGLNLSRHSEAWVFVDTPRMMIGFDNSGGVPCIFCEAHKWENRRNWTSGEYIIDRDARRVFNRMIPDVPVQFSCADGAWMAHDIQKYQ